MIVTIDGPVASGKSTIAQELAQLCNFELLNSGYLYRSLAYILVHEYHYSLQRLEHPEIGDIEEILQPEFFTYSSKQTPRIIFKDHDITSLLKSAQMDQASSLLAANQAVRSCIVRLERNIADDKNIIIEGRDTGSVVFPYAHVKFFLTAQEAIRAQRWQRDQERRGNSVTDEQARIQIYERDKRDKERTVSPLIVPVDAYYLDNSYLSHQETVQIMLNYIQEKRALLNES